MSRGGKQPLLALSQRWNAAWPWELIQIGSNIDQLQAKSHVMRRKAPSLMQNAGLCCNTEYTSFMLGIKPGCAVWRPKDTETSAFAVPRYSKAYKNYLKATSQSDVLVYAWFNINLRSHLLRFRKRRLRPSGTRPRLRGSGARGSRGSAETSRWWFNLLLSCWISLVSHLEFEFYDSQDMFINRHSWSNH